MGNVLMDVICCRKYTIVLLLFFSSFLYAESLDELTPEQAYQQGTLLFQQNKYTEARPLLKLAVEHGYPAAALMYADTYYTNLYVQTEEETEYTVKAAELGSIIGMLRASGERSLSNDSDYWSSKSSAVIRRLAEQGNAFAMQLLSASVEDRDDRSDWLIKAAKAGDPYSQHKLARRYENGDSWFIIPGKREKEIERLLKAAADSGYRPAMLDYAYRLQSRGDIEEYQAIIDTLVELGDAATIHSLASDYRVAREYQLSAYYYKIHIDSIGYEGDKVNYKTVRSLFAEVRKNLTPEQIDQVDIKVQEYLKTHTVHYQKRIKDYEYTLDSIKQAKP